MLNRYILGCSCCVVEVPTSFKHASQKETRSVAVTIGERSALRYFPVTINNGRVHLLVAEYRDFEIVAETLVNKKGE